MTAEFWQSRLLSQTVAVAFEFWASIKLVTLCDTKRKETMIFPDIFYSVFTFKGTLKVYNKRSQEQV